jgi:hypothetical protein
MSSRRNAMLSKSRAVAVVASAVVLLGCSGAAAPPPVTQSALTVADIDVGRNVATDKTIIDETNTFSAGDTFYVSVKTVGSAASATLAAHWTYGNQQVTESAQTIAPSGPAVTEFHVSRPTGPGDGWPTGDYKVEILLNGVSAGAEAFKVR